MMIILLQFKPRELLSKYDEEIEGLKRKDFQLGARGTYNTEQDKQLARIKEELRAQSVSNSISNSLQGKSGNSGVKLLKSRKSTGNFIFMVDEIFHI